MPSLPRHVRVVIFFAIEVLAVLTLLEVFKFFAAGCTFPQFRRIPLLVAGIKTGSKSIVVQFPMSIFSATL